MIMKPLCPGISKHHLFTYHEVRERLVQIHGKPKTDQDHAWLHTEIKKFRAAMPLYGLCEEFHAEIHKITNPPENLPEACAHCGATEQPSNLSKNAARVVSATGNRFKTPKIRSEPYGS
jgi:hypothetical protein